MIYLVYCYFFSCPVKFHSSWHENFWEIFKNLPLMKLEKYLFATHCSMCMFSLSPPFLSQDYYSKLIFLLFLLFKKKNLRKFSTSAYIDMAVIFKAAFFSFVGNAITEYCSCTDYFDIFVTSENRDKQHCIYIYKYK